MTKLEESGFARRAAGLSRRDLVRAIGLSAGGMALGLSSLGGGSKALAAMSFGGLSQLSLELDGGATPVYSAEGGNAVAEVIPDPPAARGPALSSSSAVVTLAAAMKEHIERALIATRGRIEGRGGTADLLGINPHTLRARMRKLKIDWSRFCEHGPS